MTLLIALVFLVWVFFTQVAALSFARLGAIRTLSLLEGVQKRFFYAPFNALLFKEPFEGLVVGCKLAATWGLLGYGWASFWGVMHVWALWPLWGTLLGALTLLVVGVGVGFVAPYLVASEKGVSYTFSVTSLFLFFALPLTLPLTYLILWQEEKEESSDELELMKETVVELLQRANVKGKLGAMDKKLIEAVIRFKDRIVREVMVPRVDLFSLPVTTSVREAAKALAEEGYSRTPVYRDTVDNVVGILMFRDLLEVYMEFERGHKESSLLEEPIETLVKRAFYTPETKKVSHLLQEFRTRQMHMAIVVDEYGGTEGVVTIEDLLEEIVGEISDEYDVDEDTPYEAEPGGAVWVVDARMSVFDAEEAFGIHIPQEGDYDTIGGYLFEKLKTIPKKGEKIEHEEFDLEVLSSTERSVEKVRISKKKKEL